METLFSWLHLSDLLIGHPGGAPGHTQVLLLDRLYKDIIEAIEQGLPNPDIIVVTGDHTYHASPREYGVARGRLLDIARAVGLGPESVFVIPGNHDVQRSVDEDRAVSRLVNAVREGAESIDNAMARPADRALLAQRQANYLDFAAGFAPACDAPEGPAEERLFWQHRRYVQGLWLRLVGLNSALCAASDADLGKLRLGEQLVRSIKNPPVEPDELVVVLTHHPVFGGWLADEKRVATWLENRAHVHLSGHVHDDAAEKARSGTSGPFVKVTAGTSHRAPAAPASVGSWPTPVSSVASMRNSATAFSPSFGYNISSILRGDDGALTLQVWPRAWSPRNMAFWSDPDNLPEGRMEVEHPLRVTLAPASSRRSLPPSRMLRRDKRFEGPGGEPAVPVPHFFGRDAEMAELKAALASEASVTAIIGSGIAGLGKTALARQFAALEARALFPEGVVWISGESIIGDLARAASRFGWSGDRAPTLDEASEFLTNELGARAVLLVIDDFDPAEIDPGRMPAPGGKSRTLLISSSSLLRDKLGAAAHILPLGRWSATTCRSFLGAFVPDLSKAPAAEIDALARFAGNLPLTMRLLERLLAHDGHDGHESPSPADLLLRLQREPLDRLDKIVKGADRGVAATFQAAFDDLDGAQRNVLIAAASCARFTRAPVAAYVAHLKDDAADRLLGELFDRALVEIDDQHERPVHMHDLFRRFARCQDGATRADATHAAFARAHVLRHDGPNDRKAMDADLPEVLEAIDRSIAAEEGPASWALLDKIQAHMAQQGRYPELIVRADKILALLSEESTEMPAVLGLLGLCYRMVGEVTRAIYCHERSFGIESKQHRPRGQAADLGNLGLCYRKLGDLKRAIDFHLRSAALYEQIGRPREQATQLGHAGNGYVNLHDLGKAVDHLEQALGLAEKIGHVEGQAVQLGNLGICYRSLGDVTKAIDHHKRSLLLNERLGRLEGQATQLANLGFAYEEQGDRVKAASHLQRSLALCWRMGLSEEHPRVSAITTALTRLAPDPSDLGDY
ncbi:MAG: tetratricopeptide repeat protein [Byssovorax sp.]